MENRLSAKPGRVKLTPEDGGAPFYVIMEMADEPTEEGTPNNKENLLTDETAALCNDAETVNEALLFLAPSNPQQRYYTVAGLYTFTVEKTGWHIVEVVGGGGLGGSGSPGSGGYVRQRVYLAKGDKVPVTVGRAGSSATPTGGTSSFGSYATAPGGTSTNISEDPGGIPVAGDFIVRGGMGDSSAGTPLSSSGTSAQGPGVGGKYETYFVDRFKPRDGAVIITWA